MTDSHLSALQNWFANSWCRTGLGFPEVLYHSTPVQFDIFDTSFSEFGAHVGTISQANSFGDWHQGQGRFILPVFVRLKNPLRLQDRGDFSPVEVGGQLADCGIINQETYNDLFDDMDFCMDDDRVSKTANWIAILQEAVVDAGFDGIVYLNRREGLSVAGKFISGEETHEWSDEHFLTQYPEAQDSYIVFNPAHIKSALCNNGQFSLNNPSITQ